jgi:hypothetical protein
MSLNNSALVVEKTRGFPSRETAKENGLRISRSLGLSNGGAIAELIDR